MCSFRSLPALLAMPRTTSRSLLAYDGQRRGLVRMLCAETHETWIEDKRYLNMTLLWEQRKEQLRKAA